MFAAVWINKFAHAQRHRESITESLKNFANDSKESVHWEPVLNKNRFSIPIPTDEWFSSCSASSIFLFSKSSYPPPPPPPRWTWLLVEAGFFTALSRFSVLSCCPWPNFSVSVSRYAVLSNSKFFLLTLRGVLIDFPSFLRWTSLPTSCQFILVFFLNKVFLHRREPEADTKWQHSEL